MPGKKGGKGLAGKSGKTDKQKAAKAAAALADRTFGMKNKNKSQKVQQYVRQVENGLYGAQPAAKKESKKEAKFAAYQARKEAEATFGSAYIPTDGKKKKLLDEEKKKAAKKKKAREEKDEIENGMPCSMCVEIREVGNKTLVPRLCAIMDKKDNLMSTDGGDQCIFIHLTDGTTVNPLLLKYICKAPGDFPYKVGDVLDIHNSFAIVRGREVRLEMIDATEMKKASGFMTDRVMQEKENQEAIRAAGGVALEERIEQKRRELVGGGTPITEETFREWKLKKLEEKRLAKEQAEAEAGKSKVRKAGTQVLSGRALFISNKDIFVDDDEAVDDDDYEVVGDLMSTEKEGGIFSFARDAEKSIIVENDDGSTMAAKMEESLYINDAEENLDDLME